MDKSLLNSKIKSTESNSLEDKASGATANVFTTRLTDYGMTIMTNELKNRLNNFILIGSQNEKDEALINILNLFENENTEENLKITYRELSEKNYIAYENAINNRYYDQNNFLTVEFSLPIDMNLNAYIYAFGIVDVTGDSKRLISITRVPLFNKVPKTHSSFSIKYTIGQEKLDSQFRDFIHNSQFIDTNYMFNASGTINTNKLTCSIDTSDINIGTKIKGEGIPVDTVVIDKYVRTLKSTKGAELKENEILISNNLTATIQNAPIFRISTFFRQDDFVTKAEFGRWQTAHNHNNLYYLVDETVSNSNKLGGFPASYYVSTIEYKALNEQMVNKLDLSGGTLIGPLYTNMKRAGEFRDNEMVPLYYIKKLLIDTKDYVDSDYDKSIKKYIDNIIGYKNDLETFNKLTIVSSINELNKAIGNYKEIAYKNKEIVSSLNFLLNAVGSAETTNKLNITDNINNILANKLDANNPSFNIAPVCTATFTEDDLKNDNKMVTVGAVNTIISKLRRTVKIDLSKEDIGQCYPVVFNENGLYKYTDSIIRNEKNSKMYNSLFRMNLKGNGSSSSMEVSYLRVTNSVIGTEYFVKKVKIFAMSSVVVVWLRGGSNYIIDLSGTDSDPIVCKGDYRLANTPTIVSPEKYDLFNKLQIGGWEYINAIDLNIDNNVDPHFIYDDI